MTSRNRIEWSYLRPQLIFQTVAATVVSIFVSIISNVPFVAAMIVMFASWPITDVIIERIASREPEYRHRITVRRPWIALFTLLAWVILAIIIHFAAEIRFLSALAYSILGGAIGGAFFGVTAAAEDARRERMQ